MSLVATLVHTINSHTSDVNFVSFCGKTLASCSGDKTVRLWSTDDFSELPCSPICGHTYSVHCCVFSPFGTLLATCSTDGKAILWNSKTGEKVTVFEHSSKNGIRVCRFAPNSTLFATGCDDDTICLWDVTAKKLIRSFQAHEATISALAFSPDSLFLVSGCMTGNMCVWDAQYGHGKYLKFMSDIHDLGVTCGEFSPTYGSAGVIDTASANVHFLLATGGNDNALKLWDFLASPGSPNVTLKLRDTLLGHSGHVMSCTFSSNGKLLASGSLDKTLRLWDPMKGEPVHTIEGHSRYVSCCAFSADCSMLASGSNDKTVMIWKLISEDQLTSEASFEDILVDLDPTLAKKSLAKWSVQDVCNWMKEIGLSQYEENFSKNAIDGTELLTLTHQTLENALGIDALGHRNKILRAIEKIQHHPILQPKSAADASDSGVPDEYLCPITREPMKEPVIAADGYTYERASITAWINSGKTNSPMTNAVLANLHLMPNRSLKMLIQRYLNG